MKEEKSYEFERLHTICMILFGHVDFLLNKEHEKIFQQVNDIFEQTNKYKEIFQDTKETKESNEGFLFLCKKFYEKYSINVFGEIGEQEDSDLLCRIVELTGLKEWDLLKFLYDNRYHHSFYSTIYYPKLKVENTEDTTCFLTDCNGHLVFSIPPKTTTTEGLMVGVYYLVDKKNDLERCIYLDSEKEEYVGQK